MIGPSDSAGATRRRSKRFMTPAPIGSTMPWSSGSVPGPTPTTELHFREGASDDLLERETADWIAGSICQSRSRVLQVGMNFLIIVGCAVLTRPHFLILGRGEGDPFLAVRP